MLIDTHCHIFNEYYDNIDSIMKNLNNVKFVINNSFNLMTSKEVLELSKKYDEVIVSCLVKNKSNEFYKRMNCTKISFCEFILDGNSYEENLYTVNLK